MKSCAAVFVYVYIYKLELSNCMMYYGRINNYVLCMYSSSFKIKIMVNYSLTAMNQSAYLYLWKYTSAWQVILLC